MGKIGKMAHFIGSQAADEEETEEPAKAESGNADTSENVEEKTDAVDGEQADE